MHTYIQTYTHIHKHTPTHTDRVAKCQIEINGTSEITMFISN